MCYLHPIPLEATQLSRTNPGLQPKGFVAVPIEAYSVTFVLKLTGMLKV
jgi:hypothetical protein